MAKRHTWLITAVLGVASAACPSGGAEVDTSNRVFSSQCPSDTAAVGVWPSQRQAPFPLWRGCAASKSGRRYRHGTWEYLDNDGHVRGTITMDQGQIRGTAKVWDQTGRLLRHGRLERGKPVGVWQVYDGQRLVPTEFVKGRQLAPTPCPPGTKAGPNRGAYYVRRCRDANKEIHGQVVRWSGRTGFIISLHSFKNDEPHGRLLDYDATTGVLTGDCIAKEGKHAGRCQRWYPTGRRASEGHFLAGKPVGEHRRWNGKGEFAVVARYDQTGKLLGIRQRCERWKRELRRALLGLSYRLRYKRRTGAEHLLVNLQSYLARDYPHVNLIFRVSIAETGVNLEAKPGTQLEGTRASVTSRGKSEVAPDKCAAFAVGGAK